MSVLGRLLVSSAERLDLPDLLSVDSYSAGDWKYFLKGLVGDTKPYVLKGFDIIDPGNAIGTQSCSIRVAESVVFYPGSNAGGFYHGLQEGHTEVAPLVPELRKNAVNYVYLTFSTFNTSVDTRAFWDPDKDGGVGGEFTQDVNTESVLKVEVNVSTGSFPANTIPVAKITVGPVVITAIEDARDLMFRLGSGGINPNPFNQYAWRALPGNPYTRSEPPTQMQAGGVNPFQGADKNILTLKEWMDAIMSKLRELGGTTYWYDDTSSFGIVTNFFDAVATSFKSKGKWLHDTTTPGLLTWTEDIQIKMTSDPRTYIIRQGSKTLADEQVMYIPMVRNQPINGTDEPVSWTNGQPYVNTIGGAVGLFSNLSKGDYIKKANDTFDKWVRVEEFYDAVNLGGSTTTAAGARSIRLSSNYLGSTGSSIARYDKGSYLAADVTVSNRNNAAINNVGGNFHWLALRSDTIENVSNIVTSTLSLAIDQHDGQTARVTSTAHGLVDGDRITITGTTNFNGTFQVEVETANIFYITLVAGPFADESGTGRYATVTTSARSTPYGFQEESANHGFNTDDTIIIAGTTNYNASYQVSVRSSTIFTIPVSAAAATETAGTATLARVIVRTEGAVQQLIQGQIIIIGGTAADNIRQYLGMQSLSETAPSYSIPISYNTLDGMANYNGVVNENITARVSKLTAMMADKAQDKTIKVLPSSGITSINNTTNGAAQEITFTPSGGSITLITPGSTGQAFVALPSSAPGISLLVNQVAYVQIDRNNTSSPAIQVANTATLTIDENIFVIAARLAGTDIWTWDGSIIATGGSPGPGFDITIIKQNANVKLVAGGTWSRSDTGGSPVLTELNVAAATTNDAALFALNSVIPGSSTIAAQTFQPTQTGVLTKIFVELSKTGSPTATYDVEVRANSAGSPGTLLDASTGNSMAAITSGTYQHNFVGGVTLTASTTYFILVRPSSGGVDGSNYISVRGSTTDVYASGQFYTSSNSGSSYTAVPTQDMKFEVRSNVTVAGTDPIITWSANAFMQIPGLANSVNTILAGNTTVIAGNVAYVQLNRTSPGGNLTVSVSPIASLVMTTDTIVIIRNVAGDVIVGNNSMLLINGESKKLYAGTSDQTLTYIGSPDNADSTPTYSSATVVAQSSSLTTAIGALDARLNTASYDESIYSATVITTGTSITIPNSKVFVSATAKDVHVIVNGIQREITRDFTVVGAGPNYTQIQFIYDLPLDSVVRFKKQLFV